MCGVLIKVEPRPALVTSDVVEAEISERYGEREVSDAVALTIASFFQSPGGLGRHFAQLASTGTVDLTHLLDAINAEREALLPNHPDLAQSHRMLDMLATWGINRPEAADR